MKRPQLNSTYEKSGKVIGLDRGARRKGLSFEQCCTFLHKVSTACMLGENLFSSGWQVELSYHSMSAEARQLDGQTCHGAMERFVWRIHEQWQTAYDRFRQDFFGEVLASEARREACDPPAS